MSESWRLCSVHAILQRENLILRNSWNDDKDLIPYPEPIQPDFVDIQRNAGKL
jgi:hypothetical protein